MNEVSFQTVSEDSLLVTWAHSDTGLSTPELSAEIGGLAREIQRGFGVSVHNVVPSYYTLLVQYDLLAITEQRLREFCLNWIQKNQTKQKGAPEFGELHLLSVFYDSRVGADLDSIAESKSMTVEQIIEAHTRPTYTVYAVGFQPGFAYLGYVPGCLEMPRHSSFRPRVDAGSVGIADRQTAIYPMESPGGWQIIGRSPEVTNHHSLRKIQTGDRVKFVAINEQEYLSLGGKL